MEESTSLVWPIVLIVLLLGSCVGFVYWKQKRSPLNFKTLAHSHYDTRSGSATFSGVNGLGNDGAKIFVKILSYARDENE